MSKGYIYNDTLHASYDEFIELQVPIIRDVIQTKMDGWLLADPRFAENGVSDLSINVTALSVDVTGHVFSVDMSVKIRNNEHSYNEPIPLPIPHFREPGKQYIAGGIKLASECFILGLGNTVRSQLIDKRLEELLE